jgi:hypothetical protein
MAEEDVLALAQDRISDWNHSARVWYYIYYILGGLAVVFTITVASKPFFLSKDDGLLSGIAWLAAIFQGLSTFLTASSKATAYRTAWRSLWLARLEYMDSEKSSDAKRQLRQAIARGWSIIDGGYSEGRQDNRRYSSTNRKRSAAPGGEA